MHEAFNPMTTMVPEIRHQKVMMTVARSTVR